MIYCTMTQDTSVLAELYKKWVGHLPQFKGVCVNTFWAVVKDDEKYVGVAQLVLIDDPIWDRRWGLVENVYVTEAYRQKGIAKQLMNFIESMAKGYGCEFVKLTSGSEKVAGHALYRSMGYKEGLSFKKKLELL